MTKIYKLVINKISLVIVLFFLIVGGFYLRSHANVSKQKIVKIGIVKQKRNLTYLPTMMTNSNQGILLAIDQFNKSEFSKIKNILIEPVIFPSNTDNIGLLDSFDSAAKSDVMAVVGVPTSKEGLLIGDLAQKSKVLTVTIGGHDKIGQFGDYVYSGSNPLSAYARLMAEYAEKMGSRSILIISDKNEPYTKTYADLLVDGLKKKTLNYFQVEIPEDQLLSEAQLNKINKSEYDLVFLFQYPLRGIATLNHLTEYGIVDHQEIFVPPAWHFDKQPIKTHLNRYHKIVCISAWNEKIINEDSVSFKEEFMRHYGMEPGISDVQEYDMTRKVIEAIKVLKNFSREELKDAFKKQVHFKGVIGWYHYDNCGGHPRKNYYLMKLNSDFEFEIVKTGQIEKLKNCDSQFTSSTIN